MIKNYNPHIKSAEAIEIKGFTDFPWASNFSPITPFIYENIEFSTIEHFYQAMKSTCLETRAKISTLSAGQAKRFTRKKGFILRDDWDLVKDSIMEIGLRIKFNQPYFKQLLLSTRDIYIEETNTWDDTYWGVCNGVGLNKLGILLMKIRNELQKNEDEKKWLIFDIDDVLFDFVPTLYEKGLFFDKLITQNHWTLWDTYNHLNYFDYDDGDKFREFIVHANILETFKSCAGSSEFLDWAKDFYKFGFITARGFHSDAENITRQFLNNQFNIDGKIIISGLYGSNKSQFIDQFPGEIAGYIDDNASHVNDFEKAGVPSVLMNQLWNKNDKVSVRIFSFDDYKKFLTRNLNGCFI